MSSFTYLSKAVVVLAAATTAEEDNIRCLCSSSEEERENPFPHLGVVLLVATVIEFFILVALVRCVYGNSFARFFFLGILDDPQQAASSYLMSIEPPAAPRRILPLMSIEPALNFTNGLSFAGSADHPECTVCLSEFSEGEEIRILSNCRHGFHIECIDTWLSSRSSCPTCRVSCVKTSVENNPPENQHDDLQAAHPPAIESTVPQQHP